MNKFVDFTTIVSPRTYGLQTYTDEQLALTGKKYLRTNLVQGLREAPSHIMQIEVTAAGVAAHCRYWREGDVAVNPTSHLLGRVKKDENGLLYADFNGARSPLGGSIYPRLPDDLEAPPLAAPAPVEPDWRNPYQTEVETLSFRIATAEVSWKRNSKKS